MLDAIDLLLMTVYNICISYGNFRNWLALYIAIVTIEAETNHSDGSLQMVAAGALSYLKGD